VGLEQRGIGVDGDLELAARRLLDVGDELHDVLGMEISRGIRGRHVPFRLRGRTEGDAKAKRYGDRMDAFHRGSPALFAKRLRTPPAARYGPGGNGAFVPHLAGTRRTALRPYNVVGACRFRRARRSGPVPLSPS